MRASKALNFEPAPCWRRSHHTEHEFYFEELDHLLHKRHRQFLDELMRHERKCFCNVGPKERSERPVDQMKRFFALCVLPVRPATRSPRWWGKPWVRPGQSPQQGLERRRRELPSPLARRSLQLPDSRWSQLAVAAAGAMPNGGWSYLPMASRAREGVSGWTSNSPRPRAGILGMASYGLRGVAACVASFWN